MEGVNEGYLQISDSVLTVLTGTGTKVGLKEKTEEGSIVVVDVIPSDF